MSELAHARPPEIRNLNVRGLQIGAATVVTIDGADLLPAPRVFLDANAVEATLDPQSTASRLVLTVPLPETISPGLSVLRIATADGFSNSVLVGLDRLPQQPIAEEAKSLPIALHGSVSGSAVSRTKFSGKANEEVIVEVEAKRIGSKLRPVAHVFDDRRIQVAWAMPSRTLAGDCRAIVKLPRDGQYTIEVHDLQYAPPGSSFFRLKVGRWKFADLAFPPAVTRGQDAVLELLGTAPGAKLPFKAPSDSEAVPFPMPQNASGSPPTVLLSSLTELVETQVNDPPMTLPSIPVAVSGRLDALRQFDRFQLAVAPGTKLTFEVFAERLGSRIDTVLELRNAQGGVLASNDDIPNSTDSRLEFTVPAGLDAVVVALRDALEIANEQAIYRLVVTSADKLQPEVTVTVKSDVSNIAAGESQVLEVNVTRRGFDGPLQLNLGQLPAGVTVTGTEIPAGSSGSLVTLTGAETSSGQLVSALTVKSADGAIATRARTDVPADDRTPVWLREQFAIATAPKSATPFQVVWADASPPTNWVLSSKLAVPVKFVRPTGMLGPIRLSFVTSQLQPKVNNQPNLPLTLRPERVVEVPVDPPVQAAINALNMLNTQLAEAVKQAATAQGDAKTAADAKVADLTSKKTAAETTVREAEAKANSNSELALVIPSVLPESSCDIAIKAELLNPERNVVLRTSYSPVRRLPVLNPLAVKLSGPTTIEQTLDAKAGAVVKLAGKIERLATFKGDVNLTLAGQPGGVAITNASVKADQSDFVLELRFPANFAVGEVKGIKLIATGPPDPLSANQPIRTEIELIVKLLPIGQ